MLGNSSQSVYSAADGSSMSQTTLPQADGCVLLHPGLYLTSYTKYFVSLTHRVLRVEESFLREVKISKKVLFFSLEFCRRLSSLFILIRVITINVCIAECVRSEKSVVIIQFDFPLIFKCLVVEK